MIAYVIDMSINSRSLTGEHYMLIIHFLFIYFCLLYLILHNHCPGSDLAAALVTRGSNHSCPPTFPSRSAGMLLLDVVMVFRRNVPRWARVFDNDDSTFVVNKRLYI